MTQLLLLQQSGQKVLDAEAALKDLATIPTADLLLLQSSGAQVSQSTDRLKALAKVPTADTAFLQKYAALSEPKVQKILTDVSKAADKSPKQWRNYFWIAVGGEIVFIPLIFLLAGYWSPRRAKQAEREHEEMVERELARLRG